MVGDVPHLTRYPEEMFEIPADLPLKLSSLAWLLGTWQGWGTIAVPASEEESSSPAAGEGGEASASPKTRFVAVLQDLQADIVGDQMRAATRTFEGVLEGDFDPTWTAREGLDRIAPGELISEEVAFWSVDTPLAVVPAGPEEPRELKVTSADTRGFAAAWSGVVAGPRVQLASDATVRVPRAPRLAHFTRMYGLVGGELMWAGDSMPTEGDYSTEITGRLLRVASAGAASEVQE